MYKFLPFGGGVTHMTTIEQHLSLMLFFDSWREGWIRLLVIQRPYNCQFCIKLCLTKSIQFPTSYF